MTARDKFDLVMVPLMKGAGDRVMDSVFGAEGLKILNDYERENGFQITPPGSWTNQAGLIYIPAEVIGEDRDGYFFTGIPSNSANWGAEKLPKGLTLKWIAKNIPSLTSLIEEVLELRKVAHTSLEIHHVARQPEFISPAGFVLGGVQIAHIIDAPLLGGRAGVTMIDVFLTTATAHTTHSYFSSPDFNQGSLTATLDESENIIVKTDVVNPRYHHQDCAREDVLHAAGLTPEESKGIMKMFALRKILQQLRSDILQKWESAHTEKHKAA